MIANMVDFLRLIERYRGYLKDKGMNFDDRGFPLLPEACFLDEWPDHMVTYEKRQAKYVTDKKRTVLCFYCDDRQIYRRLDKVMEDLPEYRQYMGVVSSDASVIRGMEREWEDLVMLANQLFMAILAVNGVKVVLNLRSGSSESEMNFNSIPKGIMCASGTLGCANLQSHLDFSYVTKVMTVRPSKLLIYGKKDPLMEEQLAVMGVSFRRYDDAHRVIRGLKPVA